MAYNEPLGLPQGSVRAILTIMLILGAIVLHAIGRPEVTIDSLAFGAVGLYFGSRKVEVQTQTRQLSDTTPMILPGDNEPELPTGFVPGGEE